MATSQNGWPAGQDRVALGVDGKFSVGGVLIAGGVLAGDVATVLGHVAERFHRRVERLIPGWCWGHAYRPIRGQTTGLSNHASGTAMDLNAPNHPQGKPGTFSAAAVREIRKILAEVDGVVRWGGDWTGSSVDEMHFEINATRARVATVAARLRGQTEEDELNADQASKLDEIHQRITRYSDQKTSDVDRDVVAALKPAIDAVGKAVADLAAAVGKLRADLPTLIADAAVDVDVTVGGKAVQP